MKLSGTIRTTWRNLNVISWAEAEFGLGETEFG
jgi:hypothetical protein